MPFTRVIILANSKKKGRYCVAGKQFNNNTIQPWVRPINASDPLNDALTTSNIQYHDFRLPSLLDIVDIHYLQSAPHRFQRENASIDQARKWEKKGSFSKSNIDALLDNPPTLWFNGNNSFHGLNDRFDKSLINNPIQSLYFINIDNLMIRTSREGAAFGDQRKRYRGFFTHNRIRYALSITDPNIYSIYGQKAEGEYQLGNCYATISMGPNEDNFCYKFIAALIF
ncbi:hypothetical protein [Serratia sp. JSRIV006]|uniref:dual OB domain-containing protein n=1 Tax=Serratia sp. JSRIV006 TaxID=2831896 RepID=UPI001CBD2472|nr:hypothetical protein [Serratia sp. JSRIV006]UAN64749.1 hypothetical protein KGP16_09360 [Serratia sp. JSRIV006]